MKLINADHLTMVDENEVDLHPYVRLAKQCREAPEVKAIPNGFGGYERGTDGLFCGRWDTDCNAEDFCAWWEERL